MENKGFLGTSPKTENMMTRKKKDWEERNLVLYPLGPPGSGGRVYKGGILHWQGNIRKSCYLNPEVLPLLFTWETKAGYPHPPETKSRGLQETILTHVFWRWGWGWGGDWFLNHIRKIKSSLLLRSREMVLYS